MWLCVDRTEGNTVVLLDDEETVYTLSREEYAALTGRPPVESDVLTATVEGNRVTAARVDEAETAARRAPARARLDRLFGRKKS